MQDKEFDELFRSKLEDLEVAPSKGLWDNIAAKVIIEKKSRSALPFISIAASILVLVTAGIFFIPKIKPAVTKPPLSAGVVQPKQPTVKITPTKIEDVNQQPVQIASVNVPAKQQNIKQRIRKQNNSLPDKIEGMLAEQQIAQVQKSEQQQQPRIDPTLVAVSPSIDAPFAADVPVSTDMEVTAVAALTAPKAPIKAVTLAAMPKKHRIRSFGDLINVVVSKVDKRKDKLIEFSSKDDDESLVTGINLGIIKVKKEEVIATNK